MKTVKVEVSSKFLIYSILLIASILLAWELKGVLMMLFVAFILNAGLRPLVDRLESRKMPRSVSIALIYLLGFGLISFLGVALASEFVNQAVGLIQSLPEIFEGLVSVVKTSFPFLAEVLPLDSLGQELTVFVNEALSSDFFSTLVTGENILNVVSQTFGVFGSIAEILVSLFTIIMVSVYMLSRKDQVYIGLTSLLPDRQEKYVNVLLKKIETSLGSWLMGQLFLMLVIALMTYVVVLIPGLLGFEGYRLDEFALPIALLAGLFEAVPSIGPLLTMFLAGMIAVGTSGVGSLVYVIISFLVIQNIEAILIVPQVMKKAVGVDPIVTILAIIGAFQVAGVIGALVVIPIITVVQITLVEAAKDHKKKERQRPKLV